MLKVGITGGIGAGKSTVAKIFEQLGIPVYKADDKARILFNTNDEVKLKIKALFGEDSYLENGTLSRKKIADTVFNNNADLEKLNAIIHPAVIADFEDWVTKQNAPFILKEAAILFESGTHKGLDKIITVSAPKQTRINRVIARDSVTQQQVESRMQNQWTEEQRVEAADFVIYNDDSQLVIPQVLDVFRNLSYKTQRGH
jgi:dephospho-CoA kinase